MAPDYGRNAGDWENSALYLSLKDKLCPFYMDEEELGNQLLYAFYTYNDQYQRFYWDRWDVQIAFTWAETCQGKNFWRVVSYIQKNQMETALKSLEDWPDD